MAAAGKEQVGIGQWNSLGLKYNYFVKGNSLKRPQRFAKQGRRLGCGKWVNIPVQKSNKVYIHMCFCLCLSVCLSLPPSLSLSLTQTLTHTLTNSHTHTHTFTHFPPPPPTHTLTELRLRCAVTFSEWIRINTDYPGFCCGTVRFTTLH